MSVQSSELLAYGATLCHATSEVANRTAIGRAYYAAYHAAGAWHEALLSPGICARKNVGIHEVLVQCLTNPTVSDRSVAMNSRALGYMLRAQKAVRHTADYDIGCSIDASVAETAVCNAQEILRRFG